MPNSRDKLSNYERLQFSAKNMPVLVQIQTTKKMFLALLGPFFKNKSAKSLATDFTGPFTIFFGPFCVLLPKF
jgi:hypothetical protein